MGYGSRKHSVRGHIPGHGTSGVIEVMAAGLKRPLLRSRRAMGPLMSPKWLTRVQAISWVPGTSRPLA